MEFVRTNPDIRGCKIALKRGGSGRHLVYLHGANGAASVQPFMTELATHFDVLVPEHPGFGGSDEPGWLENIHDLAYFYLDFLEQMKLRDVFLVGSSIGGWLALEIAIRNSSRLAALSLAAPAGLYVPGLSRGDVFLWTDEERVRNHFHDPALAERALVAVPAADEIDIKLKNQYTFARLAWEPRLFDPHLAKWLHRVNCPTQIVWGANDKVLPAAYAQEFVSRIPGATSHIVPECGHLPHVEKSAEFVRLLREFESGLPVRSSAA
jgi:pimeloyl-ACP methyl ester carboxylesterase